MMDPFAHVAGLLLIAVGIGLEIAALVMVRDAKKKAELTVTVDSKTLHRFDPAVLEALIDKLPWSAIMALITIILGMVLLMGHWPWHTA